MSSEASARNPELLAEAAPAKFVNEGAAFVSISQIVSLRLVVMLMLSSVFSRRMYGAPWRAMPDFSL